MKKIKTFLIVRLLLVILAFPGISILSRIIMSGSDSEVFLIKWVTLWFSSYSLLSILVGGYSMLTYHSNRNSLKLRYGIVAYLTVVPSILSMVALFMI